MKQKEQKKLDCPTCGYIYYSEKKIPKTGPSIETGTESFSIVDVDDATFEEANGTFWYISSFVLIDEVCFCPKCLAARPRPEAYIKRRGN